MSLVQLSDKIAKTLMVLAAAWAFVLTFIIIADITSRALFNDPLNGTREIVANSIVMIVFLQAGYAIRSRSMLSADFLVDLLPLQARRIVLALGYLLGAAFFLIIIFGGWKPGDRFLDRRRIRGRGRPAYPVLADPLHDPDRLRPGGAELSGAGLSRPVRPHAAADGSRNFREGRARLRCERSARRQIVKGTHRV